MKESLENTFVAILHTSIWEWLAVLTGLMYVILITYKRISAWIFAIYSSLLYMYVCYTSNLYLETALQFFYLVMAISGWYLWVADKKKGIQKIIRWQLKSHLKIIFFSAIGAIGLGFLFDTYTPQAYPYTDAFTTVFSLSATFMVTKKVLENWIYWIVIDAVSIYLFASRDLYLTCLLFLIYTSIAVYGYFSWKKQFELQS